MQIEVVFVGPAHRRMTCWHAFWQMCSGWQLQPGAPGACCAFLLPQPLCLPPRRGHNVRLWVCRNVRWRLGCSCAKQDWLQRMGCPDAVESVDTQRMVVIGQWLCCIFARLRTSLGFITTSGTTGTQESEQEATDRLLELGALNSSDGRFVPDLNPAASEACTSKSA